MDHLRRKVVVIGGGISGLAAAHRLLELNPLIEVTLLEATSQLGGVIRTRTEDGFLLEEGPDSFLLEKPWASALCERLGLRRSLIPTQAENRRSFVLKKGRLYPVPEGFSLFVPTRVRPLLRSPILSLLGKARIVLDLLLPRKSENREESVASFVNRRLGREAAESIARPLVESIYAGDARRLSATAVLPRLVKIEADHRSLLLGLRREQGLAKTGETAGGARYFLFASLREGMGELVRALASRLPGGSVRVDAPAVEVHRAGDSRVWRVLTKSGPPLECDALCIALPACEAVGLFQKSNPSLARKFDCVPYASSAVVNLGYLRKDVHHPLDGFGFVVPVAEARSLMACSFSSVKFSARASAESVLLRAFVGGALRPDLLELEVEALERRVRNDLSDILAIDGKPQKVLISHHWRSMPQYEIGHPSLVEAIEEEIRTLPGLAVAGNAYHGVGIPDCIRSGELAAESLVSWLRSLDNVRQHVRAEGEVRP